MIVVLLRTNPSGDQVIANGVRQCLIVVVRVGHVTILDQRVVQMTIEALLQFGHVLYARNTANRYLLLLIGIHVGLSVAGLFAGERFFGFFPLFEVGLVLRLIVHKLK